MAKTIYATPAEVDAARLIIDRDKRRGETTDPTLQRIADAKQTGDLTAPSSSSS